MPLVPNTIVANHVAQTDPKYKSRFTSAAWFDDVLRSPADVARLTRVADTVADYMCESKKIPGRKY